MPGFRGFQPDNNPRFPAPRGTWEATGRRQTVTSTPLVIGRVARRDRWHPRGSRGDHRHDAPGSGSTVHAPATAKTWRTLPYSRGRHSRLLTRRILDRDYRHRHIGRSARCERSRTPDYWALICRGISRASLTSRDYRSPTRHLSVRLHSDADRLLRSEFPRRSVSAGASSPTRRGQKRQRSARRGVGSPGSVWEPVPTR